jgi:acylphosphatase
MIRRTALFTGRVQGVGFRYTASRIAERFAVTGYVRNLPDGRVEAVVEGNDREVEAFLSAVGNEMSGHIRNVAHHDSKPMGDFDAFTIRH